MLVACDLPVDFPHRNVMVKTSLSVLLVLFPFFHLHAIEVAECKGSLVPSIQGKCAGIDFAGCCDPKGRVLWCKDNNLYCLNCADGFGLCGWNDTGDYYDCGFDEPVEDPTGQHPYGCGQCSPLCVEGAVCSADCPGACGACPAGEICLEDGACYTPQCEGKECGLDPLGFSCGQCKYGTACVEGIQKCMPVPGPCLPSQTAGCGGCGCEACVCQLYPNCCTENWDIFCVATCEFECDYDCSACPEDPTCDGLECGDFCGVDCGSCNSGEICFGGQCCLPDCNDKECGSDGCGGYCGECQGYDDCNQGACVPCQPKCDGKKCGPDGCGGSCGECPAGAKCDNGVCKKATCADSCGGSSPYDCWCDGQCQEFGDCCPDFCLVCPEICKPEEGCGTVDEIGCCSGTVLEFCQNDEIVSYDCVDDPACGWNAGAGYYDCGTDGQEDPTGAHLLNCPCTPDCDGKECGNDGCGGSCGECPGKGSACSVTGQCCLPDCTGKECGDDGCGVSCGECAQGQWCDYDTCIEEMPGGCQVSQDPGCNGCGCEACVFEKDELCKDIIWDKACAELCLQCGTTCPCIPDCEEGYCGEDGCGSTCECGEGQLCIKDQCKLNECGDITYEGCCDGIKVQWCEEARLKVKYCDNFPGECGWAAPLGYDCGTDGVEDPSGTFPKWCPGACIPDCDGKDCGDDGCSNVCGTCTNHAKCIDGVCKKADLPLVDVVTDETTGADGMTTTDITAAETPGNEISAPVDETVQSGGSGGCGLAPRPAGQTWLGLVSLLALLAAMTRFSRVRARLVVALLLAVGLGACSSTSSGEQDMVADGVLPDLKSDVGPDQSAVSDLLEQQSTPDGPVAEIPEPEDIADVPEPPDTAEQVPQPDIPDQETIEKMCVKLPKGPLELTKVPGAIASEDLAFDSDGFLVGGNNQAIFKTDSKGKSKIFVPNLQFRAGMRYTPSGRLIVCDNNLGRLLAVDPDGSVSVLMQGLKYPNGLEVDLKGWVYLSEHDASKVLRVHPYSGEYTVMTNEINNPNGMSFNVDYSILYIGSFGSPYIYQLSISEDGIPGRLEIFADMTDTPGLLDGMGVDMCGNIYICEYGATDIWRVSPDGIHKSRLVDADDSWTYLPNMQWGVAPDWNANALYIPDGWNIGVWTVDIGIPGKPRPYP